MDIHAVSASIYERTVSFKRDKYDFLLRRIGLAFVAN